MTIQGDLNNETAFEDTPIDQNDLEEVANNLPNPEENTQGLDKRVDNMRMFDLGDFSLENKKTFFNRNNWNIAVGSKGRSVEMIPTDILVKSLNGDESRTGTNIQMYSDFDFSPTIGTDNISAIENSGNKIIIKKDGLYKVGFKFGVEFVEHIEGYIIGLSTSSGDTLFHKEYGSGKGIQINVSGSCSGSCSCEGGGSCSGSSNGVGTIYLDNLALTRRYNSGAREGYMKLQKGDQIQLVLLAVYEAGYPSGTIKLLDGYTSRNIQYLKSNR